MNTSELTYQGELRTTAIHVFSGTQIITDAPLDNNGKAESFSPTDLVATALACCMVTIMGIECNKQGWNIDGTQMEVRKLMVSSPRRIGEVHINFVIPDRGLTDSDKLILENKALNCPVAQSIHPDINQVITFNYHEVEG
jgi:putative redox protein